MKVHVTYNRDSIGHFQFVPDNDNIQLESVSEKGYVRRGPSPRVKNDVIPVLKKATRNGRTYYLLVYMRPDKASQVLRSGAGIGYIAQVLEHMSHVAITDPRKQRMFGRTFTDSFAHLSGQVYSHINHEVRRGARWEDKQIAHERIIRARNTHIVELEDGTTIMSKALIDPDSMRWGVATRIKKVDGTEQESAFIGTVTHDEFGRREFNINRISGYDTDAVSALTSYLQLRYAKIRINTNNIDDASLKAFLLNGYGANVEAPRELIQSVIQRLEGRGILDKIPAVRTILNNARTITDVMNALTKAGIVSINDPLVNEIARHVREKNPGYLEFHSVGRNNEIYTSSQLTLHGTMLQRAADNDTHRGWFSPRRQVSVE